MKIGVDVLRLLRGVPMRKPFIFLALFTLLYGCAGTATKTIPEAEVPFSVTDVSHGLPITGLWRQHLALYSLKGYRFSAILAPPPRKAKPEEKRPFIYVFDEEEKRWSEAKYSFPRIDYDYGSIAVGDMNNDGLFDLVLATHAGKIFILINNGDGSFREMPLPLKEDFHSRAVAIADVNGDGWPDIVAASEAPFVPGYVMKGLLVAINKEGKDWDTRLVENNLQIQSDSIAVGDMRGNGKTDIAIAPLTTVGEDNKKALWLGDGAGGFSYYPIDFGGKMPTRVRMGDVDGDGRDELVFGLVRPFGKGGGFFLKSYKWSNEGLVEISEGLPVFKYPAAFDVASLDGSGKKDIIILSEDGLHILKYGPSGWVEFFHYPIPSKDTLGASDIRVAAQQDGSYLVVYGLGEENPEHGKGLRAYLLRPKK